MGILGRLGRQVSGREIGLDQTGWWRGNEHKKSLKGEEKTTDHLEALGPNGNVWQVLRVRSVPYVLESELKKLEMPKSTNDNNKSPPAPQALSLQPKDEEKLKSA